MMGTRPQTIGYALTDSPAGLAALMYDYNNGEPERLLSKDEMLDDVTLYWLTNSSDLVGAAVLGDNGPKRSSRGRAEDRRDLAPGGHHGISGGSLSRARDMGPARLSQPDLLQRGGQGRTLRRLGGAGALLSRTARRLQVASAGTLIARLNASTKGRPHENNSYHGDSSAVRRKRFGAARGAVAAAGSRSAPICCGTILSVSGREVIQVRVDFAPGVAFPRTAIPAKRSPTSSKACWSTRSKASRR